jgi:tRNA A37 threonylcarbamoyladenosine dehydratase
MQKFWTFASVGVAAVCSLWYLKAVANDAKKSKSSSKKSKTKPEEYPQDLLREQLSRNFSFIGEEGMQKLRSAFVVVVGAGGVGSHAVHLLARSGVGRIRVIDFDQVTLSSLNRHALARIEDVGKAKTAVLAAHLAEIAPFCVVEAVQEKFDACVAERLLTSESLATTFVVDCIDNIDTKVELLQWCHLRKIKIVSSMGSGAKRDPTRIQIADISQTFEDPLARVTRRKLKKIGIDSGIPVVYSTEKPSSDVGLLPLDQATLAGQDVRNLAPLPKFRCRILPVIGTLPAIFGCTLASFVINSIAGLTVGASDYLACKNRISEYLKLHKDLANRLDPKKLSVSVKEMGYLYEEVWNACSVYSMAREKLVFAKLNAEESALPWNLILLTVEEMELFEKGLLKLEDWVYAKALSIKEEYARDQRV